MPDYRITATIEVDLVIDADSEEDAEDRAEMEVWDFIGGHKTELSLQIDNIVRENT